MNKSLISAIAACTALAIPAAAMSQAASVPPSPSSSAMNATMMCRPAMPNEKPSAILMGVSPRTAIVCKSMPSDVMTKDKSGPDLSKALSADQVDAAWRSYINSIFVVPGGGG
jgi:hypothetical protein